jgi:hypothetical protein
MRAAGVLASAGCLTAVRAFIWSEKVTRILPLSFQGTPTD